MVDKDFYQKLGALVEAWKTAQRELDTATVDEAPKIVQKPFSLNSQAEIDDYLSAIETRNARISEYYRRRRVLTANIEKVESTIKDYIPEELWDFDIVCNGYRVRVRTKLDATGGSLEIVKA